MEWSGPLLQRGAKHLAGFLTPVVTELGRSKRRVAAGRYVHGLLLPGQRKSVAPMAARLGVDAQGLQRFVSVSPWSDQAVWKVVRQQIISIWNRWRRGWWTKPAG
jgi:SRSO17 transposase